MNDVPLQLFDPRLGQPALRMERLEVAAGESWSFRSNVFSILWVREGTGTFWTDMAHYPFDAHCLLFSVPYQIGRLDTCSPAAGVVIQFHANFFCIETYHEEVGCNGVLFNDCTGVPVMRLDEALESRVCEMAEALRRELRDAGLAQSEMLVSYLKILLVQLTRAKLARRDVTLMPQAKRPAVLDELRDLVEQRFRELHKPADYANLLHVTSKTLSKLVKMHLGTTPTELIRDRLMRQAKWEMLHTTKPVKQVSAELGFADVFYFSRLYKRATGCSPTFFRAYETAIRGGRNLSMESRDPSMAGLHAPANDSGIQVPAGGADRQRRAGTSQNRQMQHGSHNKDF